MKKINSYRIGMLAALFCTALASCKEEKGNGPLTKDGPVPDPVTSVTVKATSGGGTLKYTVPKSQDALYIKAVYELNGVKEVKSSIYNDSLVIVGLGRTQEYTINLYTVSKSEIESAPVTVKFTPLPSPIWSAFPSLTLDADLGGAIVNYLNPGGAPVTIRIVAKDEKGKWQIVESATTTQKSGFITKRDMPAVPTEFGVYLTDRWGNTTDTLKKTFTPLFEQKADKKLWKPVVINALWNSVMWNDITNYYLGTAVLTKAWDEDYTETGYMHSITGGSVTNLSFTIDLGKPMKLTRMKYWQRGSIAPTSNLYASTNAENFSLAGSIDGINWVPLLANAKLVKPSGLAVGQTTQEDRDVAAKGNDFIFPTNLPEIRYFRWLNTKTFGSLTYMTVGEISLWSK